MESSLDNPNFENPLAGEIGDLKDKVAIVEQRIDDTLSTVKTEITTLATDEVDVIPDSVDILEEEEPSFFESIFGGILAKPDVVDTEEDVSVETDQETSVLDTAEEKVPQTPPQLHLMILTTNLFHFSKLFP